MHVERFTLPTHDGWTLELHRGVRPGKPPGKPVIFVPGFGMNAFIFRFHPRGTSFMEHLLDAGLDPWSVDLRGQTTSKARPLASPSISLADLAFVDLPAAFDEVARLTGYERAHAIGCSLGGTLLYGYGGSVPDHRIDKLVTMGTPLRWTNPSLLVQAVARLMPMFGSIPVRGSRQMARLVLPVAAQLFPSVLSVYLNPKLTHTGEAVDQLVRTVEDPHPRVNRQLGRWILAKDLKLGSVDVTEALRSFTRPLFVVCGNADRIAPAETCLAAVGITGGPVDSLVVGSEREQFAHADLFIADVCPDRVYTPICRWLQAGDVE